MPLVESSLVRNSFFTYYVGTNGKGASLVETRKLEQTFNDGAGITVHLNGNFIRKGAKMLNLFGKKHILATRSGGKSADDKADSIHKKRLDPMTINTRRGEKNKSLKTAMASNKKDTVGAVSKIDYALSPTKDVYGKKLEKAPSATEEPSSTFFVIDALTPDQVRKVFIDAVKGNTFTSGEDTHLELDCGAGNLWQYAEGKTLQKDKYTKMKVSVYYDGTTHYFYHCTGPA